MWVSCPPRLPASLFNFPAVGLLRSGTGRRGVREDAGIAGWGLPPAAPAKDRGRGASLVAYGLGRRRIRRNNLFA